MTCSRVERSSGSPPRLPKSLTVRVFWVVDMLDLLSGSVLLMTAGPGPEGEKAGLSRPRAARPEGLALRPGRPWVQRPDACAAPETKGEPAWLGPGDPGGEISASGGVPGCAPPANRSRQTEEKCLSEQTVEQDFHMPWPEAAATLGVEGKRSRGRACPCCGGKTSLASVRRTAVSYCGCSEDGSDGSGAEDRPAEPEPRPGGRSGWWAFDAPPPLRVPRFARRGGPEPAGYGTTLRGVPSGLHPARGNPLRVPATSPVRTGNWGGHCPARPGCCAAPVISPLRPPGVRAVSASIASSYGRPAGPPPWPGKPEALAV